jgi:hypothetical protein
MQKQSLRLVGRKLQIATGEAGLPAAKRDKYRESFEACGFELPDVINHGERSTKARTPVSDIGTRIQSALESACNYTMTCGNCRNYLRSLNRTTTHDIDQITERLLRELQLPIAKREQIGDTKAQRVWLRAIVSEVIES